jgi:SagB-type dehydrogenase family enzyme
VALEVRANGAIVASFHGHSVGLGTLNPEAADRAMRLDAGLPLASFAPGGGDVDSQVHQLVRRLARHGLLEYRVQHPRTGADQVVIEPQSADYWPATPPLDGAEALALSRFAYMRRRGTELVLESPRAAALFRIGDSGVAAAIAALCAPRQVKQLRRQEGFPGLELLALLLHGGILFKVDGTGDLGLRPVEGDHHLVLWDFHDLLFHARSTEGRHANPVGGVFPHVGVVPQLPAVRKRWPGTKIDLRKAPDAAAETVTPLARLLQQRHSISRFDDRRPITLDELSRFLDTTARVRSTWKSELELGAARTTLTYAVRPYPSAGASYELELYLAVNLCDGLGRGFYHYDAGGHALVPVSVGTQELDALLTRAAFAMDAPGVPQILITMAARFGRLSWKYSALAYALILKNTGVLTQTFYLMATEMGLGGCAIGSINIDLFARMTGIEFHVEGPVGQFALGRPAAPAVPD